MYFGYGIRNSKERVKTDYQNRIFPCFESRRHYKHDKFVSEPVNAEEVKQAGESTKEGEEFTKL